MFAMLIQETGGPEVFQYGEVATPEPGPKEVRIRIAYAGVNPADWKDRQGMLEQYYTYHFPYIPGFDAAGVIDKVGKDVTNFAVGDRVFTAGNHGSGGWGSYAEYLVASSDRAAMIPSSMDFAEAAALPVAGLTAWQGLFGRGNLRSGQSILVHGGSGGLGSFAVQFARWIGARVAATCSTPNIAYLKELGVERVIDYRTENIDEVVKEWAPGGLDFLMDAVGVSTLPNGLDLVKTGGNFVSIPTLVDDGDIPASLAAAVKRSVTRTFATMTDEACGETLAKIADLIVTGHVKLPRIRQMSLRDVADAHRIIEKGHNQGKLVLKVADN